MGSGDVRAGGAFIELMTDSKKLDAGLKAAKESVESFGAGLRSIGASFAAMGAAITAPLIAAAHHFADFGHDVKHMAEMTGMSSEALSALGPKMDEVGHGVLLMQRAVAEGGDEARKSLGALGLSFSDLKGKLPEEQLGLIADRMSTVEDQGQKVALAMGLFGRSGAEMLPTLEKGSAGLNEMVDRSRKMGTSLDKDAVAAADKLFKSFKSLTQSIEGFGMAIGKAVAPLLGPLIEKFADIVQGATEWVNENGNLIQSTFEVGAGLVVLGTAFLTLGAAIAAAMSPALLIAGAIMLIGVSTLAVLDCLGVTSTGFGEMFNSIRIGGTGLGTWMAALWVFIKEGWNGIVTAMEWVGLAIWDSIQYALTKVENFFLAIIQGIAKGIKWLIEGFNSVAPAALQVSTAWADRINETAQHQRDIGNSQIEDRKKRRNELIQSGRSTADGYDKEMKQLFIKDPQSGNKAFDFDSSKLKDGFKHLGDGIWGGIMKGLDVAKLQLPTPDLSDHSAAKRFGQTDTGKAPGMFNMEKGSVVGTFNSSSVAQLGSGGNAAERTAVAAEKIARNTDPNNSGVGAV